MGNTVEAIYKIKAVLDVSDIKSNSKVIQDNLKNVGLPANMSSNFTRIFKELEQETDNFKSKLEGSFNTKGDISGLEKSGQRISKLYDEISSEIEKIQGKNLSEIKLVDTKEIQQAKNALAELQSKLTSKVEAGGLKEVETAIQKISTVSKNQNIDAFFKAFKSGDIQAAQTHLEALSNSAKNFTNQANLTVFNNQISVMKDKLSQLSSVDGLDEVKKDIGDVRNNLTNLQTAELEKLATNLGNVKGQSDQASNSVNEFKNTVVDGASAQKQLNDEVEQVKSRVKYFFSLANGVYLFKRAVKEAYDTVKELDAAMTETAVVTDFSVGDMWDKLPEYSALAKELGATIQGAYETMTLFYQQGLDTNEAFALGTETMKMARIAGLDYANATDLMTAALRGFNMELNETSAQRVNDVYSELAAITASDTEEIANAMTKTASIANSANMEFETTAAFLSQMIETTREPAENLGTAMKTIIARFTEMKEAPSDIFEVEGEEVNVNKVDAALASVGVSLKNAKGEFRDLDDVFLDLAEKWDSLDIMSQRYIATTAAGSRQQSRFIAMMSNYERTLELVEAAQNSTGASQQQFEKTQESLEAKLNRLKDAWDQFTMGIASSSFIKGAVDLLTKILETINKLTDSSNGFVNSISKIALAFGTFKGASALFNKAMDKMGNTLANSMKKAGVTGGEAAADAVGTGFTNRYDKVSKQMKARGAGLASAFSNV